MIVRIIVVVKSVVSIISSESPDVAVAVPVGGGGCTTPGELICPAKTETASAELKAMVAHV